jgi:hypothetical protein
MHIPVTTDISFPAHELRFKEHKGVVSFRSAPDRDGEAIWRHLPDLPASLVDYLVVACERFWLRHQRCIGFVLLLNPVTHLWVCEIPKQVCGRYSSQFWAEGKMLVSVPTGFKVAGTLQCYAKDPRTDLNPVPNFPGLHFVCLAPNFSQTLGLLLVCSPEPKDCRELNADAVVIDDQRAIVEVASPRFCFLDE